MDSWSRNFELLINSRTPLIWIRTKEEERLYKVIDQSCKKLNIKRFASWDCVNGIKGVLNENGKFSNNCLLYTSDAADETEGVDIGVSRGLGDVYKRQVKN